MRSPLSIWLTPVGAIEFHYKREKPTACEGSTSAGGNCFAERIAACIDAARFGVRNIYLFGSTELGNASVGSDIDLIIVTEGMEQQHRELELWLEGWSLCLAESSFQLYGLPRQRPPRC